MRGRRRQRKKNWQRSPIRPLVERWMELHQPELEAFAREILEQQLLYGHACIRLAPDLLRWPAR